MKLKKLFISSALISFLGFNGACLAQKVKFENATEELPEVVVTATKTPHLLKDVPVETVVVTKENIEKSTAKNVSEILRQIPGFYIQSENVPGSSAWRSKLRGLDFDSGYGLILINGERGFGGGMGEYGTSINQIPPEMIEKIEIVKGPASVLYGSDAMVGVVNIITKSVPDKPLFTLSGGYGEYGTSTLNTGLGRWITDKFGFFIDAHYDKAERSKYGARRDDFEGKYVLTNLAYKLTPKINLNLGLNYGKLDWKYESDEKVRISPSIDINFPDSSFLKIRGYYYNFNMDLFSPGYTHRYGDVSYNQMEVQYTKPIGINHLFTGGIEFLHRNVDLTVEGYSKIDKNMDITSGYIQDEISFDPLVIVLGVRWDHNSLYGTEFNPKASLMWKLKEDTRLRFSIGRAFKSPTIRQLYVYFYHNGWWNIPNEDLKPEKSWGYSAGIEHEFSDKLSANLTLFRNNVKDMIVRVDISSNQRTWENVQKAYTQGVEISIKTKPFKNFNLNLGYTYLDTENKDTEKDLTYCPHHTISLGIDYKIKPLKILVHWDTNYISREYTNSDNTKTIPDYSISNLKVIKDISKIIKFSFEINNVFDSDYGQPDKDWLGRNIFGKVSFKF